MASCPEAKKTFFYRTSKIELLGGVFLKIASIPQKVKEYFNTGTREIVRVIPNENYSLTVYFDNNEVRVYDMSKNLFGVFEILKDKNKFKEVFIDEYGNIAWDIDKNIDSSVHWNNRIDLCKDAVYMGSTEKVPGT